MSLDGDGTLGLVGDPPAATQSSPDGFARQDRNCNAVPGILRKEYRAMDLLKHLLGSRVILGNADVDE